MKWLQKIVVLICGFISVSIPLHWTMWPPDASPFVVKIVSVENITTYKSIIWNEAMHRHTFNHCKLINEANNRRCDWGDANTTGRTGWGEFTLSDTSCTCPWTLTNCDITNIDSEWLPIFMCLIIHRRWRTTWPVLRQELEKTRKSGR